MSYGKWNLKGQILSFTDVLLSLISIVGAGKIKGDVGFINYIRGDSILSGGSC